MAVILAVYLAELGTPPFGVGVVLTVAVAGTAGMTVFWGVLADRWGRRRSLTVLSVMMVVAGVMFTVTDNVWVLAVAVCIGGISVSGADLGAVNSLDQAILPQVTADQHRTTVFTLYNLCATLAAALGALFTGAVPIFKDLWGDTVTAYRPLFILYAVVGLASVVILGTLSSRTEPPRSDRPQPWLGLHRSRAWVLRLSALFALDAFAGGFVVQALVAYWFTIRWDLGPQVLAVIFAFDWILAASFLPLAIWLSRRFGLVRTLALVQVPVGMLAIAIPLAPTAWLAVLCYLLRACLAQLDIPTRQSYSMAMVAHDERTATASVTNVTRIGVGGVAPMVAGYAYGTAVLATPFLISGVAKIVYGLLFYLSFRDHRTPDEREQALFAAGPDGRSPGP